MPLKNKKYSCISLLIGVLLFSCHTQKQTANYFGIETRNSSRIIFLVDISGSMVGGGEKGLNLTGEDVLKGGVEIAANLALNEILDVPGYIIFI